MRDAGLLCRRPVAVPRESRIPAVPPSPPPPGAAEPGPRPLAGLAPDDLRGLVDGGPLSRPEPLPDRPPVPAGEIPGPDEPTGGGLAAVLRIGPFRRLWVALTLSSLGDWLGILATTALAQQLGHGYSGKAYAVGGVLIVRLAPTVLFGPLAGAFADRFDRRWTMVVSDLVRFGLFVTIPVVRTYVWLLVASFLIECFSLFWNPAKEASVPNLLPPEQLEAANTLSLLATYGTGAVAAGVFAVLSTLNRALASGIPFFHTNPVDLALYFDAVTFLVSGGTVYTLRTIGRARRAGPAGQADGQGLLSSLREGLRFVGSEPLVRGLVVGIVGGFTGAGCVIALGRLFVGLLHGGDAAYGLLFGAVFVGLAGGMVAGPRLLGSFSRKRLFGLAVVMAGGAMAVLAVIPNLVLALLLTVALGAFAGVAWVTGYTLLGREVADEMRGRTFALVQSLVRIDLLLVLAAAPLLAGLIGRHAIRLPNKAVVRADGVTLVMLAGGLVSLAVGVLAFRQMDDRRGVPIVADVWSSLRGRHLHRPESPYPGRFLVVEGGEGSGKSTLVALLAEWLDGLGHEVLVTREPGATPLGARLRTLLLDPAHGPVTARAEALLYAADRAEHVETVVRPALERGAVVLSDRYIDSSLAYQGAGRALDPRTVARLSTWATSGLLPDATVLLDLPAAAGLARAGIRAAHNGDGPDRIENETLEFHERVRDQFRALANAAPGRYLVVSAEQPPAEVLREVQRELAVVLPRLVERAA